ncbi:hypothetical protein VN0250_01720 [Helicobacter pylori]
MKPFSPLHSQLKFPQKSAFFKKLSLKLASSFPLTKSSKTLKRIFHQTPQKEGVQKNKGFKKKGFKNKGFKKKGFKKKGFKERKALKEIP